MSPDFIPASPIDGIAQPVSADVATRQPLSEPQEEERVSDPTQSRVQKMIPAIFLLIAFLYVIPAVALMATFPRPDSSLAALRMMGIGAYALGAVGWLLFGFFGLTRIAAIKNRAHLKVVAFTRLAIGVLPMLAISGLTLFVIAAEPRLTLEIVAPASSADLIAPVSVTLGMNTALKVFTQEKLKPLKYSWDFTGDGITDQETFDPQATYIVTKSGIYNFSSKVTMTNGEIKTVTLRLVVPKASFNLDPPSPIIDEAVKFSLENLFPKGDEKTVPKLLKAKWDFDTDGIVDLETELLTATTTYHKLGTVTATVTAILSNQTQTTFFRRMEVIKSPEQPFPITLETEPKLLLGSPPFGVFFTIKTKEPIANVQWDFGDKKSGESLRIGHTFAEVGNFSVVATVRSQSGAIAKLSKVVQVTNPLNIPDLRFTGKPEVKNFTIEGQSPLTIDITPITQQPLISFSWDVQDATELEVTDKSLHAVYRDEGQYFIDLIGIDPEQNVYRKRIEVKVSPPQSIVSFTMDPPTPTAPSVVTFDASDTFVPITEQIAGFEWDFGDGANNADKTKFSGSRIEHRYEKPGTYSVTLTVRTNSNKIFTAKQTLLVKAPLIDACFLPSRSTGKAPLGIRFDSSCSTGDFSTWLWDFGDNAQSDLQSPTHVYVLPGEYRVSLTASNTSGLRSTKTSIITVTAQ